MRINNPKLPTSPLPPAYLSATLHAPPPYLSSPPPFAHLPSPPPPSTPGTHTLTPHLQLVFEGGQGHELHWGQRHLARVVDQPGHTPPTDLAGHLQGRERSSEVNRELRGAAGESPLARSAPPRSRRLTSHSSLTLSAAAVTDSVSVTSKVSGWMMASEPTAASCSASPSTARRTPAYTSHP